MASVEELYPSKFRHYLHVLEAAFRSTAALEGQKILVVKVHGEFAQVRLEGDWLGGRKIIGFGSGFVAEAAEVILTTKGAKPNAAQVSGVGIINGPYIDVLPLCALNRRV